VSGSELAHTSDIQHLYSNHHGWLRGWLRSRLGCSETAADLTQDTFVKVLLRDTSTTSIREPRAYLTHIARSLMINHWRRRDIEQAYLQALMLLPEPESPSPEHQELILETLYEIDAALDSLPSDVRQAFLLAQLEGMKYRDIAARLAVSEITIKRYIKRALVQCMLVME
jgi:RNA polymerase sigma factor (sigma-70 family)